MATASVILGVLGLVAICAGLPLMLPALFFGGAGASFAALVLGLVGRGSNNAAATAGVVLGLFGVVGTAAVFFLFLGRAAPGEPMSAPPVIEVMPPT